MSCEAPEFGALVAQLHARSEVGVIRAQLPDGGYLAAIVYENDERSLWACFDPHSQSGKALLQDWDKHQNMHITFACQGTELNNRQALRNTLIAELLAAPPPKSYQDTTPKGRQQQFMQRLEVMRHIAEAMSADKQRLFVMMLDIPLGACPH